MDISYNIENFDVPPDEELICSICRCVFKDPVECSCRHVFCRECIKNWICNKRTCPICRKRTYEFDLKPVPPIIKNMINKMKMICPNLSNGCKEKVVLDSYSRHVEMCPFQNVKCSNPKCLVSCLKKDSEKHINELCEHRLLTCKKDCNLQFSAAKMKGHNCVKALKAVIEDKGKTESALLRKIDDLNSEVTAIKMKLEDLRDQDYYDVSDISTDAYHSDLSLGSNQELLPLPLAAARGVFQRFSRDVSSFFSMITDRSQFHEDNASEDPQDPSSPVNLSGSDWSQSEINRNSETSQSLVFSDSNDDNDPSVSPDRVRSSTPVEIIPETSLSASSTSSSDSSSQEPRTRSNVLKRRFPETSPENTTTDSDHPSLDSLPVTRARISRGSRFFRFMYSSSDISEGRPVSGLQSLDRDIFTAETSDTDISEGRPVSGLQSLDRDIFTAETSDTDEEQSAFPVSRVPVPTVEMISSNSEDNFEAIDEDSNYEVRVPARTWDLLERYANESSGEAWTP